jgi:hypothetical protein
MDNTTSQEFYYWWQRTRGDYDDKSKMDAWQKYCNDNAYTNVTGIPPSRYAEFMAVWALIFG